MDLRYRDAEKLEEFAQIGFGGGLGVEALSGTSQGPLEITRGELKSCD